MKSLVLISLKGGCGKSTCAAELSRALKRANYKVAALDLDYHAPNLPFFFEGLEDPELLQRGSGDSLVPPVSKEGIPIFSLHHFWPPEVAVEVKDEIAIDDVKQILTPGIIDWGFLLDFLVVDTPPDSVGVITIAFQAPNPLALVVCQPSRVSRADAQRTISLLREKQVPILGIICNQAWFEGSHKPLFDLKVEDIQALADKYALPKVWAVPHSDNLAPHFDAIVKSLDTIKPVTLKVKEYSEEPLRQMGKLAKILKALGGKSE